MKIKYQYNMVLMILSGPIKSQSLIKLWLQNQTIAVSGLWWHQNQFVSVINATVSTAVWILLVKLAQRGTSGKSHQ